ncbi:diacylglycerol kinase family protein [Kitasatospora cathayae]|uniref:Diacylglycerol kinase n=1 Tax=Kitasatospora cathayae TaxID=3004092 RepID=A0ABY7Q4N2_9ACTN|nr:diacylglycerol kinase [Kitasatospora sp. HUAS 3-15]WBP87663.1 diacylglycerol kinase [Kitasatospora sp. HUAS 3-15]
MSSLSTPATGGPEPLLLLLDPVARQTDGESVRIAKDVLCGGADVKVAYPESPSELDRMLSHRGRRLPVVIGSDLALQRVLQALHRHRELGADPVGMVPVGRAEELATARALGVPGEPVRAARAVLSGAPRTFDLLVDDGGGVALGGVRITGGGARRLVGRTGGWRSLWAKLAAAEQANALTPDAVDHSPRVRVEADGRLLADVHRPVRLVQLILPGARQSDAADADADADGADGAADADGAGVLEVVVHAPGALVRARAASVSVVGRGFGYEADGHPVGPVRARTWTVHPGAWGLLLPAA